MEDMSSLLSGYDYRFKPKGKSSPMVMIRSKPSKSTIHGADYNSDNKHPSPDNNTLDDLLFHDFVSNVPPKGDDNINGDDDDLIPGFGGTCDANKKKENNSRATSGISPLRKPSVPSTHSTSSLIEEDAFIVLEADSFTADDSSRATSKTSPIQKSSVPSTRSASSLIEEDPFIVLESDSVPADEPSDLFTELLEQRGKPNPSRNKDVGISSVQGDGLFDLDPIVGIAKAKQREKNRSSSEISPHGAHVPVIKKTTGDPFIVFSEDDLDGLRVDKFPESHRTPVNDSDIFQNALESFFDSASQWNNSPGPDTSSRDPTYIDDDHLTSMFEGIPSFGISQQIGVESGKRQKAEDIHQRRADPTYIDDDYLTSMFEGIPSFGISQQIGVEIGERQKAEDIHQRRADKALAEKKERDQKMQWELAERQRIAESLDASLKGWSEGKEGNLRALLSTLQDVLWEDSGWEPVSLADLIASASVKKIYRKATLCLHPDKVQQKGANIQQKYIAEKVFDLLKEAWIKLNKEELS